MTIDLPPKWNYWMWDEAGQYNYKYDHDMSDHPDCEFLERTAWDEEWTRRLFWTANEAAALSFGRSPDKVPWDNDPFGVKVMDGESEFATYFCELRRQIIEAQEKGILPKAIPALMYIQWAELSNVPFPPTLAHLIQRFYNSITEPADSGAEATIGKTAKQRTKVPEPPVHPRQRNNLLRVILAVAKDKYHHGKRPGAAKRISDAMTREGARLDEETILKYLKEAEDLP